MFLIGGFLSVLILAELFEIPSWVSSVCSFLSVMGSGVFCSAFVTLCNEKQNKTNEKKKKDEQREYLISSVKQSFMRLCEREFMEFSRFYAECILKKDNKIVKEPFTVKDIGRKMCVFIEKIEDFEAEVSKKENVVVISMETLEFERIKKKHLIANNLIYYNSLLQQLSGLLSATPTYLVSEIFTSKDVDDLKSLTSDIQDIISFSSDLQLEDGSVLAFKKILFEHVEDILALLMIPEDSTVMCWHK